MCAFRTKREDDHGVLSVSTTQNKVVDLYFSVDSMLSWYPLDLRYDLKVSEKQEQLFLIAIEGMNTLEKTYDTISKYTRYANHDCKTSVNTMCINTVQEHNEQVIKFGVKTGVIHEGCTVESMFKQIHVLMNTLVKDVSTSFLTYLSQEEKSSYLMLPIELLLSQAFEKTSAEEDKLFIQLGELFSLAQLVRKFGKEVLPCL